MSGMHTRLHLCAPRIRRSLWARRGGMGLSSLQSGQGWGQPSVSALLCRAQLSQAPWWLGRSASPLTGLLGHTAECGL